MGRLLTSAFFIQPQVVKNSVCQMHQTGTEMLQRRAPGLVRLFCGFTTVYVLAMGVNAAPANNCYRKTCLGTEYDIREAVCCENRLYPGAGLSCCGNQTFNPAAATCCKVVDGYTVTAVVIQGLSEKVSSCCGQKAYNSLSDICCNSTVIAKPAPLAQCCGEEVIDADKQMCCGPNKTILTRESRHHQCCGHDQYNTKTHCCCEMNETLEILEKHHIDSVCCVKESEAYEDHKQLHCGPTTNKTILTRESRDHQCCGHDQYNTKTHCCCEMNETLEIHHTDATCCQNKSEAYEDHKQLHCGPTTNKTILTRESRDHQCCGHDQYNTKTHCCCEMNETLEIHHTDATCCQNKSEAYEDHKQLHCGPTTNKTILTRESRDHQCCGHDQYNTKTHCCCEMNETLEILEKHHIDSACCVKESEAYEDHKQLHCGPTTNKTILTRESRDHQCCGHDQYNTKTHCCCEMNETLEILEKHHIDSVCCVKESEAYEDHKQLHCGPTTNKMILTRESRDHQCCGHDQYNTKTHCCCEMNETLEIHHTDATCCQNKSDVQQQKPGPQPICTEPQTSLCGSSCYNPNEFRCCERTSQWCCPQGVTEGRCDAAPIVYNPHTHVCCDGRVSPWKPRIDQFHGPPKQHYCGTEVYRPHNEICCDGHRHPKVENMNCCGVHAYNIKNQQMKCCAGTLHNLTLTDKLGHEAKCCGSILQQTQDVCCSSEDNEVLYLAKAGFQFCGHLYYKTSLWSCCAGKLSPGHHQDKTIKDTRLQSVNNLNEIDLCEKMLIGTVESVSLRSIMFSSVLKIHGRNSSVKLLSSPYILETPDGCSSPELIPGKTYFFDEVNFYTDSNHNSIFQSLHFIISKCCRREVTAG